MVNSPGLLHHTIVRCILEPTQYSDKAGNGFVQWIDDTLVHAEDERSHLELLRKLFMQLKQYKVRLSSRKCMFTAEEVEFCGSRIHKHG